MDKLSSGIIIVFAAINIIAFLAMMIDKLKSRDQAAERISEGLLFFMALAFGSVGVYAGMFAFRHKTRKWYFLAGIPLAILENLALLYVVNQYLTLNISNL